MRINITYYLELLNCYNQISHLANGNEYFDALNNALATAQICDKKFEYNRKKCVKEMNKFVENVMEIATAQGWEKPIATIIDNFKKWNKAFLENLHAVYEEKDIIRSKHESNFN